MGGAVAGAREVCGGGGEGEKCSPWGGAAASVE